MAQSSPRRLRPQSVSGTDHALRVTTELRRDRQPRPSEDRDLPPSSSTRRGSGSSPDGTSPAWIDTECMARRAPSPLPPRWNRGSPVAAAALSEAIGGYAALFESPLTQRRRQRSWFPAAWVLAAVSLGTGPWADGNARYEDSQM